jgi:T-complex protein 1 subunit delta
MTDRNMTQHDSEKCKDVRQTNITAARAVADVVRTSLGPKGMDKMVSTFKLLFTLSIDPRLKG